MRTQKLSSLSSEKDQSHEWLRRATCSRHTIFRQTRAFLDSAHGTARPPHIFDQRIRQWRFLNIRTSRFMRSESLIRPYTLLVTSCITHKFVYFTLLHRSSFPSCLLSFWMRIWHCLWGGGGGERPTDSMALSFYWTWARLFDSEKSQPYLCRQQSWMRWFHLSDMQRVTEHYSRNVTCETVGRW